MGLLDKLKNLFTDEEEIFEIEEVEEPKKVVEKKEEKITPLPTFMREKLNKEEPKAVDEIENILHNYAEFTEEEKSKTEVKKEEDFVVEENKTFKFPVFDDNDFVEQPKIVEKRVVKELPKPEVKKTTTLYNGSKDKKNKEVKKFKPTPIISPVYGILDKNYKKEEVKSKPESSNQLTRASSKKIDFESVRLKAYGVLDDEPNDKYTIHDLIDDTNIEVIEPTNLLYEMTTDEKTTIEEAEDNYYDFGQDYTLTRNKLHNNIEDEIKIVNHNNEEEVKAEKIEVKEQQVVNNTVVEDAIEENELELTEDLFSLIDAMYDERNEN